MDFNSTQQLPLPKPDCVYQGEQCQDEYAKTYQEYDELLQTLPKARGWMTKHLVQYQGHWLSPEYALKGVLFVQNHFKAKPSQIFLATYPKCGTTWLRALMFSTLNRKRYDFSAHPLLENGPHDCFPVLDTSIDPNNTNFDALSLSQTLCSTHIPYDLLPHTVTGSGCKFVYICRQPKDVLISKWLFLNKIRTDKEIPPLSLNEALELFCEGISHYGPYWDHVLGYWKASLESPHKVLFLKYEDMKMEPVVQLKRLANFMCEPFTMEEEEQGVVQQILDLCSFNNLTNLEVNKHGSKNFATGLVVNNSEFFRKGEVRDWENYLNNEMAEKIDKITKEKFSRWGLSFD